jgi:hypothetical protein
MLPVYKFWGVPVSMVKTKIVERVSSVYVKSLVKTKEASAIKAKNPNMNVTELRNIF